jgi:hypothetical protein
MQDLSKITNAFIIHEVSVNDAVHKWLNLIHSIVFGKRFHTMHSLFLLLSEKINERKVKLEQKLIFFFLTFSNEPLYDFNSHLILLFHIEVQDYQPHLIRS